MEYFYQLNANKYKKWQLIFSQIKKFIMIILNKWKRHTDYS